jgi:hypothetical protein
VEQRTGARRHRAPVQPLRIAWSWFWALILLGTTLGLTVAVCHEAWLLGQPVWAGFFAVAALADLVLYFYVVHLWVNCLFD